MTCLLLIRHGQTDWNVEARWQGQSDVPLNAKGLEQAGQIARMLHDRHLDAIYSSDLTRALQTAQLLSTGVGLPVTVDPRLREVYQGEWEGMLISEIEERYAREFRLRRENPLSVAPPGGETTRHVQERVISAVQDILAKYPGGTVAVVSHGFAIAVILASYQGIPIDEVWALFPKNGEMREIEIVGHPN
jgi:broad specificity phosphatase PhoE